MADILNEHYPGAINWKKHIDGYRHSGQSKASYCLTHGLDLGQFRYHYRRWREDRKQSKAFANAQTSPMFSPVIIKPSRQVSTIAEHTIPRHQGSGIELQLANGIRCKVEANFCPITLKRLMEVSK